MSCNLRTAISFSLQIAAFATAFPIAARAQSAPSALEEIVGCINQCDIEAILRTAGDELGRVLRVDRVALRLGEEVEG